MLTHHRHHEGLEFTAQQIEPALGSGLDRWRRHLLDLVARIAEITRRTVDPGEQFLMDGIAVGLPGYRHLERAGILPFIERHRHPERVARVALGHDPRGESHIPHLAADGTLHRHQLCQHAALGRHGRSDKIGDPAKRRLDRRQPAEGRRTTQRATDVIAVMNGPEACRSS